MDCEICDSLANPQFNIHKTDYWSVDLADDQYNLGRCFVTLRRHCRSLSGLNKEEQKDFFEILKKLEGAMKKSFGANLFNWTCLLNNAFKKKPWNSHVHWHFRPRYSKKIEFSGEIFEDKEFGSHYQRKTDRILPKGVMDNIVDEIRKNWG